MSETVELKNPWMIAVWPGMGHVAISAGYYLIAKLGLHLLAEFPARELFDVESVTVQGGLIQPSRLPLSRLFVWTDPKQEHDLVVFIGEAQPPSGKYLFCHKLMDAARQLGIQRVYTFAAMATRMHPEEGSRVFGAATDPDLLAELKQMQLEILKDGSIGGLNGVLLGVAAEGGMPGACLLGEMPHVFAQFPYPKASLAVLRAFSRLAGVELDLTELAEQVEAVDQQLGELLNKVEPTAESDTAAEEESWNVMPQEPQEGAISSQDQTWIEQLFEQAADDRAKAYELKRELDRLGVFQEYEDRFLDLFKK